MDEHQRVYLNGHTMGQFCQDPRAGIALQVSITDSWSERVKIEQVITYSDWTMTIFYRVHDKNFSNGLSCFVVLNFVHGYCYY